MPEERGDPILEDIKEIALGVGFGIIFAAAFGTVAKATIEVAGDTVKDLLKEIRT